MHVQADTGARSARGRPSDCLDHRAGDHASALIDACPGRAAAAGVDLDELDVGRNEGAVSRNAAKASIPWRADRNAIEIAQDDPFEDLRSDIERVRQTPSLGA